MTFQSLNSPEKTDFEWTYCTNVHPLHTLESWKKAIVFFGRELKQQLGRESSSIPMGMWFNNAVARDILRGADSWKLDKEHIQKHLGFLMEEGISTFTLNSFPFGNFQQNVVKTEVYKPDWTDPSRLEYTVNCARILSYVMGERILGTLSTVPLGWKQNWSQEKTQEAAKNLLHCVVQLQKMREERGKILQLCIEAEPGCAIENTQETVDFWEKVLRPLAKEHGISEEVLKAHCGVCYDTCHQAVQFEDGVEALKILQNMDIPVGKMQLSNALEFLPDANMETLGIRQQFVEERFLHQTRIWDEDSRNVMGYNDLPEALLDCVQHSDRWNMPWRVHYHLPLFAHEMLAERGLSTTVEEMKKALGYALEQKLCTHFEVETYTWNILPEPWKPSNDVELAKNIAKEMKMVMGFAKNHVKN
jgi:hypothetical protein